MWRRRLLRAGILILAGVILAGLLGSCASQRLEGPVGPRAKVADAVSSFRAATKAVDQAYVEGRIGHRTFLDLHDQLQNARTYLNAVKKSGDPSERSTQIELLRTALNQIYNELPRE